MLAKIDTLCAERDRLRKEQGGPAKGPRWEEQVITPDGCGMTDIATDLRERFDFAVIWFLERYEVLPDEQSVTDLSDEDSKAVELLKTLSDTVDAIPPPLIEASETLRNAAPDLFEKMLMHGVQVVGFGFAPTTATEFLEVLNRTVERDMAKA